MHISEHFDIWMVNGAGLMVGIIFWKQGEKSGEVIPEDFPV